MRICLRLLHTRRSTVEYVFFYMLLFYFLNFRCIRNIRIGNYKLPIVHKDIELLFIFETLYGELKYTFSAFMDWYVRTKGILIYIFHLY